MKNLNMRLDMRPDGVLIICEALPLHHVHATQASSSHIVIDRAAIRCALACVSYNCDVALFPSFFVGEKDQPQKFEACCFDPKKKVFEHVAKGVFCINDYFCGFY